MLRRARGYTARMRRHLPLILSLSLLLLPARAKCDNADPSAAKPAAAEGKTAEEPKPVPGSGSAPSSAFRPLGGGQAAPAAAPSLAAARTRFASTVEGYVSSRAEEGLWDFKDDKGRLHKLAFVSADKASVADEGQGRYTGVVRFKEGKRPVSVQMTVAASGQFWKVVDSRLAPPPAPK